MLEEANGNNKKVYDIIKRAFKKLQKSNVAISRDEWLQEAIKSEKSQSLVCARAIIITNMNNGLESHLEVYKEEK